MKKWIDRLLAYLFIAGIIVVILGVLFFHLFSDLKEYWEVRDIGMAFRVFWLSILFSAISITGILYYLKIMNTYTGQDFFVFLWIISPFMGINLVKYLDYLAGNAYRALWIWYVGLVILFFVGRHILTKDR